MDKYVFRDQTNTLFLLYKYYEAAIPFFAEVAEKRNSWRESRGARNKKADKRISHVAMQRIYINICLGNETIFVENARSKQISSHKKRIKFESNLFEMLMIKNNHQTNSTNRT